MIRFGVILARGNLGDLESSNLQMLIVVIATSRESWYSQPSLDELDREAEASEIFYISCSF